MKCENLQFNLPLYADDALEDHNRLNVEAHLVYCPLCRAKLTEFQLLKNDLRFSIPHPEVPADLIYSVKNAVAAELKRPAPEPIYIFSPSFRKWLQYRLMPYSVGTVVSVFLTLSLLLTLLSTREATQEGVEKAQKQSERGAVLVAANRNSGTAPIDFPDSPELNLPISLESPRINPTGALLALSKSIVRGKMKDEDVTVVADVFGNGLARIAEVVEAPRDRRAMQDLERALNEDKSDAPFVSSNQDKRSDIVRVVLKIQRVDVVEETMLPANTPQNR